ncbi:MAG TPA: AAA family ATPase, partial [Dongiaceae bacterium]|nr:AAA family ATPase [Dongiaceae bacterium]
MPDLRDLEIIVHSKVPLVVIETYEEPRALELIARAGIKQNMPVFVWSVTEGLKRVDLEHPTSERLTNEPDATLSHIKATGRPGLYVLCDFHPYLQDNPKNVRLLKEIAMRYEQLQHTVILLSHALTIPPEIKRYCAQMELSLPGDEELLNMIREEATLWSNRNGGQKVRTDNRTLEKLVANLRGMTHSDARRLARGAIIDDGAITASDLPDMNKAKFQLLDMGSVLSFEYDTADFAEVGGLTGLKRWLQQRRDIFHNPQPNLDVPKGILLLGVQGSGKSLAAKAVAGLWGVPLLRLDCAALYNKFIGESEKNLRDA